MPVCARCFSHNLIKAGLYKGQQRWQCRDCRLTTTRVRKRRPRNVKPSPSALPLVQGLCQYAEADYYDNWEFRGYICNTNNKIRCPTDGNSSSCSLFKLRVEQLRGLDIVREDI